MVTFCLTKSEKIWYNWMLISIYQDFKPKELLDLSERIFMTSSVPYSFVPGTKAKADEVNANFIAVLDKIEQVNTDTKSQLNSSITNLSNTKADKSEIDGNWTSYVGYIAQSITIPTEFYESYDLSEMLPDDGNVYEVIVNAIIRTNSTIHNAIELLVTTSLCRGTYLCRAVTRTQGQTQIASGSIIIPVPPDRKIEFLTGGASNAPSYPNGCAFKISAYRKAG